MCTCYCILIPTVPPMVYLQRPVICNRMSCWVCRILYRISCVIDRKSRRTVDYVGREHTRSFSIMLALAEEVIVRRSFSVHGIVVASSLAIYTMA